MLKKVLLIAILANFLFLLPSAFALNCSLCTVGACYCNVTECSTGSLDVFSTQCTGIPQKEIVFTNSSFVWTGAQASDYYFQVFCGDGTTKSTCTHVNLTSIVTTTTTTSSTTTTYQKSACPYDCCIADPLYISKYCDEGYECYGNQCIEITTTYAQTTETTENNNSPINYSLIGIVAVLVMVAVFAFYFFRMRKTQPHDKWEDLYKKYGRR